jgi:DNA primase
VLCFDGDAAGARAAARAAELALPMLAPDRTLRIATLPAAEDPDTLLRRQGPAAFQAVLDGARPLVDCLYDLARAATGADTPEQRAALRNRLREAAGRIPDKALAAEYWVALSGRFYEERRRQRPTRPLRPGVTTPSASPGPAPPRPRATQHSVAAERARILTAILLRHPQLWHEVDHAYATLELPEALHKLRDALRNWADHADVLDSRALIDHLTISGFQPEVDFALAAAPVPLPACAAADSMPAEAHEGWWHIFGFLSMERLREEVAAAQSDAARNLTRQTEDRLKALKSALNKVMAGEPDGVGLAA